MIPLQERGRRCHFSRCASMPAPRGMGLPAKLGDALKIVPDDASGPKGRANEACIEFFAKLLKVPRSSVTIASGQSSRNKVIRVTGVIAEGVRKHLGS